MRRFRLSPLGTDHLGILNRETEALIVPQSEKLSFTLKKNSPKVWSSFANCPKIWDDRDWKNLINYDKNVTIYS